MDEVKSDTADVTANYQCRCCLSTSASEYVNLMAPISDSYTYLDGFNMCTQLSAEQDDGLPAHLCIGCSHDLQIAFDFMHVARQADEALRACIAIEVSNIVGPAVEDSEQVDDCSEDDYIVEELEDDADIMEVEVLDEHILEDSMEAAGFTYEKDDICAYEMQGQHETDNSQQVNERSKVEMHNTDYYPEDEADDVYLREYNEKEILSTQHDNESSGQLAPSGSKWKCVQCKSVLCGDVSYVGHMNMHKNVRPYKCKHCRCVFRCKYVLEKHVDLRHPPEMPIVRCSFTCSTCKAVFSNKSQLAEHLMEHESVAEIYDCTKCTKTFDDTATLEQHMKLVHSTEIYTQCPHCLIDPMPRVKLAEHFRIVHPDEHRKHFPSVGRPCNEQNKITPWQCEICQRCMRSESALRRHHNIHLDQRTHVCMLCSKNFSTASLLRTHFKIMHHGGYEEKLPNDGDEDNTSVKCHICKKRLLRKNLNKHLALHEKKEREAAEEPKSTFLCAYCSRECKNLKTLNQHEKIHKNEKSDMSFVCGDCGREYGTRQLYLQHHKQAHKERDNICSICGNAFKLKNQLVNHLKLHLEKNIECPRCDKKYARAFDLNVHMRTHTGELPYACHLCDRRFAIKVRLTYHLQKHYGVKHTCKDCGLQFNSKQKLKSHSYKHTGMPYRCETCHGHGFANRDVFKRHLLRVHNTTMSDEDLVEMFQRNTGKTVRIRTVKEIEQLGVPNNEIMENLISSDDIAMETEIEYA